MIELDIVCPLYNADEYIDNLLLKIKLQKKVAIRNVVFPITIGNNDEEVIAKIIGEGFTFFKVSKSDFSHSNTRQKAIVEYCNSKIVIMISQDVNLFEEYCFYNLASSIDNNVVYSYGKQVNFKRNIEKYIRESNYGNKCEILQETDIEEMQIKAFFASDAFSCYSRDVFIKVNGYDNLHMMMSEDMYYSKKILELGYCKAYVPDAVVEHSHKYTLKELYTRYYETGKWFAQNNSFKNYSISGVGFSLAFYVLKRAIKEFNIPVLLRWLPDMLVRFLGMRKGRKNGKC